MYFDWEEQSLGTEGKQSGESTERSGEPLPERVRPGSQWRGFSKRLSLCDIFQNKNTTGDGARRTGDSGGGQ